MEDTIQALHDLGYRGMMGILRARKHGVITPDEYISIRDYAYDVLDIPRDWFRHYVWSA